MKTSFAVTAALLLAASAAPAQAASTTLTCNVPSVADVEAQFAAFSSAWATKDPDTVTKLFAADAVLLPTVSNKPRTNPAEVRDYFVSFLKNSPVGTINTSTVKTDCNTASRVGVWTVGMTNPTTGAKSEVKARYSFIYKLEGGVWKIDHLHSSAMPEAGR